MHQAHMPPKEGTRSDAATGILPRDRLMSTTFIGLLLTQFLGVTNDNILRWLVIGVGKEIVNPTQISSVLAIGSACLVLPYLLLAAPAGYLADRFSKRSVIIWCKVAEIVLMVLASVVIGHKYAMFTVVALVGCQAALFGPAKFGSIPEMLRSNKISSANGLLGLATVVATAVGTAVGNWLSVVSGVVVDGTFYPEHWWVHATVMIGVAVAGLASSFLIMPLTAADPKRPFPWDMAGQTIRDLKTLGHDRGLLRVAIGITFFWTLAMLAHLNIDQFAWEGNITSQTQVTPLLGALIVGVGIGSVLAGLWSGGKVELGILPIGASGLALFSFLLYTVQGAFVGEAGTFTIS